MFWKADAKEPTYLPCSNEDPRCQETLRRLKERSDWMQKVGVPRLIDKARHKFTTAAQTDVGQTFARIRMLKDGMRRIK